MGREWKAALGELIGRARDELIIAAPYITAAGASFVTSRLSRTITEGGRVAILTDLSPMPICQGATDPGAVLAIAGGSLDSRVVHLPRLHAKVYIADRSAAIVTSGNLTQGGLQSNYEYGMLLSESGEVDAIRNDIVDYMNLGAGVARDRLAQYCEVADRVRSDFVRSQREISGAAQRRFRDALREAEDELVSLRLAEGAPHSIFARTILYLLKREGPLDTPRLHDCIRELHPDLCDDAIDRVIDGRHYGKKWKHAVRTAQQHLRERGFIMRQGRLWCLVANRP
jgi:phosphatidylserine/phosphatidylglycerophosphate/cardiolipin synthase-like enzyme